MQNMNRRGFLSGTAWMGATAFLAGCIRSRELGFGDGGKMAEYADKPFKKLRVGIIGLGRGQAGVDGFNVIPGCELVAICDLNQTRISETLKKTAMAGRPTPKVYTGSEDAWKGLCDSGDVDLVYNATPWALHVPIALYAMRAGKHVATEVPSAFTVEECWELVETSESLNRHCMQLENCCYGETEMLALNLCRKGILGELVHGEGAYIHDLRGHNFGAWDDAVGGGKNGPAYWSYWRLKHNLKHGGNQYPTHGLLPIMQYMNVNRGDRLDYLVSVDSIQSGFEAYAKAKFPDDSWQSRINVGMGDMNTTVIRTVNGKTIMVQHDISTPRPYSRINKITGTKGILADYPLRLGWEEHSGDGVHEFFDAAKTAEMRERYKHPLWKQYGSCATKMGGHGGMDFLMVLRLAYCLQNGLPLDQNVYDLATSCSICELTERSAANRGSSEDIPDFTRGGWQSTKPLDIDVANMAKMGV